MLSQCRQTEGKKHLHWRPCLMDVRRKGIVTVIQTTLSHSNPPNSNQSDPMQWWIYGVGRAPTEHYFYNFYVICGKKYCKQDCIPVGCVPPACWPYLPACSAPGVYLVPGGVCSGRVCTWGVCFRGDVCTWSQGGVCSKGGVCSWWGGVCFRGGCTCPGTPPLWTKFLTHAYENITLPQSSFVGGNNRLAPREILDPPLSCKCPRFYILPRGSTGREWLIRSHSSARFCFELSGNLN